MEKSAKRELTFKILYSLQIKKEVNEEEIQLFLEDNNLKERDKKLILLRYYKEKTQSQVAEILGISQVQVSRIEKKILKNMKECLIRDVS